MRRKGLALGHGKGYYNWLPSDPKVHEDSGMGIKQPQSISPMAMKIPPQIKKVEKMWGFAKNDMMSEMEILRVKHRINNGKITAEAFWQMREDRPVQISPEQTRKGLDWLKNLWKTPMGAERKNNPFGTDEEEILTNFNRFELVEFYDKGNVYATYKEPVYRVWGNYKEPVYRVWGNNGSYFDYYYDGRNRERPIAIIG